MFPTSYARSWWFLWIPYPRGRWNRSLAIFKRFQDGAFRQTTFASPSAWRAFPLTHHLPGHPLHRFRRKLWTNTYLGLEPSSTEDDWIFGWRSRLASQILILFWSFTLLHCRHMKRLLNGCPPWIQFLRIRSWRGSMWICKKRFPIYQVYPKCLAALLCGAAIRMKASTSLQE